jgi:hypothetical protein
VYDLCLAALPIAARSGRPGLHLLVELAGETRAERPAAAGRPSSGPPARRARPGDDFHRELVSTAMAYLDHGQRLDHTAAALHVHPNTVRYRLRRLHELAGVPLVPGEPGEGLTVLATVGLWWALRTWRDSPPGARSATAEFDA